MQCNMTHAIKPEFLASRHQYDTFERQAYVLAYTFPRGKDSTLRKLQNKLFPFVDVSHTVMYYWVRIIEVKKTQVEHLLLAELQMLLPHEDISNSLAVEAMAIPENTRNKSYSHNTAVLFRWTGIYIRALDKKSNISVAGIITFPYIYLNRILDILRAFAFL